MTDHLHPQADPRLQPQARYILPSFIEHSSFGVKESNPYNKLFEERIIFLGSQVDDDIANRLCAQILLLSAEDATKDIHLYINSPGGSISAGMAIYDTMVLAPCDVATYAMGMAA